MNSTTIKSTDIVIHSKYISSYHTHVPFTVINKGCITKHKNSSKNEFRGTS